MQVARSNSLWVDIDAPVRYLNKEQLEIFEALLIPNVDEFTVTTEVGIRGGGEPELSYWLLSWINWIWCDKNELVSNITKNN